MNNSEMVSNSDMKEIFQNVMKNLPQDVKLSQRQTQKMQEGFMKVSQSLQKSVNKMVESSSDDGQLSPDAQSKFSEEMVKILLPYMQKMAKDLEEDSNGA